MKRIWPHLLLPTLVPLLGFGNMANAKETNSFVAPPQSEVHLAIGPVMAGIARSEGWDTQVGGELHLVRLNPSDRLAAIGEAFGALTFASDETIRLYLDSYVGLKVTADLTVGVALAPVIDLHPNRRSIFGAQATAWLHAGIAPYVSASRMWGLGASNKAEFSIGLRIPFSVANF